MKNCVLPFTALLVIAMGLMVFVNEDTSIWYLILDGMVLNAGMAMMMTPLMSNALSSINVKLSSHGSSILNTLQQLAGAAGTALFVAIMGIGASHSSATTPEGLPDPLGFVTDGVTIAFWFGVALAVVALIMTVIFKIDAKRGPVEVVRSEDTPAGH